MTCGHLVVGGDAWPVQREHKLLARAKVGFCRRRRDLVRPLEELVVVEAMSAEERVRGRVHVGIGEFEDSVVREPENLGYAPRARRRL